jgi:hypothetical protein
MRWYHRDCAVDPFPRVTTAIVSLQFVYLYHCCSSNNRNSDTGVVRSLWYCVCTITVVAVISNQPVLMLLQYHRITA